jgi:hypothetical protein
VNDPNVITTMNNPNVITATIAALGLILACISLGWQIWTHRRSHKEDIRGRLTISRKSLGPGVNAIGLVLDIWNNGQVPVFIKSVALTWKVDKPEATMQLIFQLCSSQKGPLQPGEERSFILPASPLLRAPSNQPEDKLWVSVKSPKGEVLRLEGDVVRPLLVALAKTSWAEGQLKSNSDKSQI